MAHANPASFLHVSRPDIDLPDDVPYDDARVYGQGRTALDRLVAEAVLVPDAVDCFHIYRQRMHLGTGWVQQTGVVGLASVADYDSGVIKTHEHTRPDKELDRVRHIDALDAHDEPVFLLAARSGAVDSVVAQVICTDPAWDVTTPDGVQHTWWVVPRGLTAAVREAFAELPALYVADGHHRSAAASRVAALRHAEDPTPQPFDAFLSVVFPEDELTVLAYNRVVTDLGGLSVAQLLSALATDFEVVPSALPVEPTEPHTFGMYVDGAWYQLRLRQDRVAVGDVLAQLDVAILQDLVLSALLGVGDPRTDSRLRFVGGIRGVAGLAGQVDTGVGAVAFSLFPTSTHDLMAVADLGETMPPKSTWFEPKLASGLAVHRWN